MARACWRSWARIGMALSATALLVACGTSEGPCKEDYDCEGSETCNLATKKCEPIVCREDSDCVDPRFVCVDNACIPFVPEE